MDAVSHGCVNARNRTHPKYREHSGLPGRKQVDRIVNFETLGQLAASSYLVRRSTSRMD